MKPPSARARGFTLVEVILTTVLAAVLLSALWTLLSMHVRLFDTGQTRTEQSQLARTLLKQIADDLHNVVQAPPPAPPIVMPAGLPMIASTPPPATSSTSTSSSGSSGPSAPASSSTPSPSSSSSAAAMSAVPPPRPGAAVPLPPGAPGGPPASAGPGQMAQTPTVQGPQMAQMPTVPQPQMAQMPTIQAPAMKAMPQILPPGAPGGPPLKAAPMAQGAAVPPAPAPTQANSNPSQNSASANQNASNSGPSQQNTSQQSSSQQTPPPSTSPLAANSANAVVTTSSLRPAGLFGTETQLQIDVSQPASVRDNVEVEVHRPGEPAPSSALELRTVVYSFEERRQPNRPPGEPAMALVRRETNWEEAHPANGPSPAELRDQRQGAPAGPLSGLPGSEDTDDVTLKRTGIQHDNPPEIAPEVEQFGMRYFDGSTWSNEWDSVARKGLPVAVEVAMQLRAFEDQEQAPAGDAPADDAQAKRPKLPIYRLVIHLPLATASAPAAGAPRGGRDVKPPLGPETYGPRR